VRVTLSYPGVMDHAQQAAMSLLEDGNLEVFATTFVHRQGGALDRALSDGGWRGRIGRQLRRRAVMPELAAHTVTRPGLEILRTLAAQAGAGPIAVDKIWDRLAFDFDRWVGDTFVDRSDVVAAFEYTALASFERAKRAGRASVLHLPSLDSLVSKILEDRERETWPALRRDTDPYFDGKFAERYARRRQEIALADVIVANSQLTKRTHVAAGADAAKIHVVPLAAPLPIDEARPPGPTAEPLCVMWSGSFKLAKGAHYLLDAWGDLGAGGAARLAIYGQVAMPPAMLSQLPPGIEFKGSVPRAEVMEAYARADVLVFPTLADGFGQATVEALSRGAPVILTDQAGSADLITPGVNGFIVPAADASALRDALQWCLDNRLQLQAMRAAALETARARQWSDYRRDLSREMRLGLIGAGFVQHLG
jgi:glycosyltransferase involved in cell wall biosynthesis